MKTEKELDNLFKQGLEEPGNYQSYREGDWLALEAMLDKEKKRGIVFWLPILSGVAALLVLALAWLFVKPATDKNIKNKIVSVVKPAPKHLDITAATIKKPALTPAGKDKNNTGTTNDLAQQPANNPKTHRLPVNGKTISGGVNSMPFLTAKVKTGPVTGDEKGNNTVAPAQQNEMLGAVDTRVFPQGELNKAVAFNTVSVNSNNQPNSKKAVKLSGFHPQYALTVLASSNLNGVGTFSGSKMGTAGGVLFSVGLTKRFTISTGAVYADVPYDTEFYNYHTSYKFKTNPETVSADCRVLDIPLNIDYQFARKGKNAFSVGTGLSTYVMLREDYHYNYANYNPYALSDVSFANRNRHLLGVLNLSATYQRQLNTKLSLAVQPYLKLPLTDIGNGEVKLQSTGVAVGLSWNINTLKR